MPSPSVYENWEWPYHEALTWMQHVRERCSQTGEMSIGIGAHAKPVITLGRHAGDGEIRDAAFLASQGVEVVRVDRGGGATYHGPGQVVLYPVIKLAVMPAQAGIQGITIPEFTSHLEQIMIDVLATYEIIAHRIDNEPGVFVDGAKIGAIGLRVSQRIVTHGLSLNVSNTLDFYSRFRPCRKDDARVTSMEAVLGQKVKASEVGRHLLARFV